MPYSLLTGLLFTGGGSLRKLVRLVSRKRFDAPAAVLRLYRKMPSSRIYSSLDATALRSVHYSEKEPAVSISSWMRIYHDVAVLEFPQSGGRFEGVDDFREWRRQYPPARLKFHTRRITHRADLVIVENLISYDGAPRMYTVSLMEFRCDRVAHERLYIVYGWDAAQWRTPWRAERSADPPPPPP